MAADPEGGALLWKEGPNENEMPWNDADGRSEETVGGKEAGEEETTPPDCVTTVQDLNGRIWCLKYIKAE